MSGKKGRQAWTRLGARLLTPLLPVQPGAGYHVVTKWGHSPGNGAGATKPSACPPAGIPSSAWSLQLWPVPPTHPHQRSELGRRAQEHHVHICPLHFQQGLSGAAPSAAPGLTLVVEPRDSARPSGQSRQECLLGPEPAETRAGLQAAEGRGPISLPTSCCSFFSADPSPRFAVSQKEGLLHSWKSSLISTLGPRTHSSCE